MAWKLRRTRHDLVHAHFCRSAVYAAYLSGKPYIAHCHGTDIRLDLNWLKKRCLKKARKVLVSTPDMLEILPYATWLPNPVDMKRFRPLKKHDGNKVFYFPHWYEGLSLQPLTYFMSIW
jgi:glycosyltransferase involved in cell wall biosynthesis